MRFWSWRLGLAALLAVSALAAVGCRTGALETHSSPTDRDGSATAPADPPCRFG